MAQASVKVSRRYLISSVPAVAAGVALATPAIAGPALASPNAAERKLFEIEAEVRELAEQAKLAGRAHTEAEVAMITWDRRNPKPTLPEIEQASEQAVDDWIRASLAADDPKKFYEENPSPNAHVVAADDAHDKALEQHRDRRRAALDACRYEEREEAFERLVDEMNAKFEDAAVIQATTIEGLRCKARLIEASGDNVSLQKGLVEDLLAWPGSAPAA